MKFFYKYLNMKDFLIFEFVGEPKDAQWTNVVKQMRSKFGMDSKAKKKIDLGQLLAFRQGANFKDLDLAIRPYEIINFNEHIILRKVTSARFQEWQNTVGKKDHTDIFPANATEEEKMDILMNHGTLIDSTNTLSGRIFKPYCFICGDENHLRHECPHKRVCGIPKRQSRKRKRTCIATPPKYTPSQAQWTRESTQQKSINGKVNTELYLADYQNTTTSSLSDTWDVYSLSISS